MEDMECLYFQIPGKSGRAVVLHPSNVLQIFWYGCFALHINFVLGPEFLEYMFFGLTEILSKFHNFWNSYFWSHSNSLTLTPVPEELKSMFAIMHIKFFERSRNPGIGGLRHSKIFRAFQKFWNFHFRPQKDCVDVPAILESVFGIHQSSCVPADILVSLFGVAHRFCARSRISGLDVFRSPRVPFCVSRIRPLLSNCEYIKN